MGKFFGSLLWFLGGVSVAWTVLAILLLARAPADCPVCSLVVRGHVGPAAGEWGTWLMAMTAINWIIMVALDIIFAYLVVTSLYRRHLCMPSLRLTPEQGSGDMLPLRKDD